MKTLLAVIALAAMIGGCGLMGPGGLFPSTDIPVSPTLSPAAQAAQKAINEANVTLAATANVIAQNVTDGIWTKPEAQSYLDKVKDFAKKTDAAQVLLNGGDILNAKNQAELLKSLILTLHREVAAKARKP
jgi:soluble cytochrome b562